MTIDFEAELGTLLESQLRRAPACPSRLAEAMKYSLLAPGKRIRPRLTLASGKMLGLSVRATLPAAVAIEVIHCFTLIHDDLPCMDNDDFRRGRPSNHKAHGEAMALLAGDGLLALAFEILLATPDVSATNLRSAMRTLAWASGPRGVIGGQAAESSLDSSSTLADLEAMQALKTGALFVAALGMPADLAGIAEESSRGRAIQKFANALGLAFQAADDLEDAEQDRKSGAAAPPTQILRYLSASDARRRAKDRLLGAMRELQTEFGESAHELIAIAQEVLGKA